MYRGGATVLLLAILVSIAPSFWLQLVYGDQYSQYGALLRGYALFAVLAFATVPLQAALRAYEITRYIFYSYLLGAVFSLVSAHYLVSTFGLIGVILGVISVQVLIIGSYSMAIKRVAERSNQG